MIPGFRPPAPGETSVISYPACGILSELPDGSRRGRVHTHTHTHVSHAQARVSEHDTFMFELLACVFVYRALESVCACVTWKSHSVQIRLRNGCRPVTGRWALSCWPGTIPVQTCVPGTIVTSTSDTLKSVRLDTSLHGYLTVRPPWCGLPRAQVRGQRLAGP